MMTSTHLPLVSVVIPNYNHSLYLRERIECVLNQDYSNIEVILLDDCSSDNSVEIIEEYRNNPKVTQICVNVQNSGSTFKQWERGIDLTKGEYVWIAESDDSADVHFLSVIMKVLLNNSSSCIGFCNSLLIDSWGNPIGNRDSDDYCTATYTLHSGKNFIKTKMLYHNRIYNASAVVFKKSVWNNMDRDFTNYKYCGDWFFWLEVLRQGDIVWIHSDYNRFRKHQNKVSPKADRLGLDFEEMHNLLHYMQERHCLSVCQLAMIKGNVFLNLITSKVIEPDARRREYIAWLKESPFIMVYSLCRIIQVFPRRLLSKLRIVKKYKYPKVLKLE